MGLTGFLLLAGSFAILSKVSAFSSVGQVDYNITSFKPTGFNLSSWLLNPKFNLTVEFTNPTVKTFKFKSFSGKIMYKGKRVSTINTLETFQLDPKTSKKVDFNLNTAVTDAVQIGHDIFSGKAAPALLDGVIEFNGGITLPVKTELKIELPIA